MTTKLVALSDMHGSLPDVTSLPEADAYLVCGDMMFDRVGEEHVDTYMRWLEVLPAKQVGVIPGNHDIKLVNRRMSSGKVYDLRHDKLVVDGIAIGGFWWSYCADMPELARIWAFMTPYHEEAKRLLSTLPKCDILVSHSPPAGLCDKWGDRGIGFPGLLETAYDCGARLIVCGHVHQCSGEVDSVLGVHVINTACAVTVIAVDKDEKGVMHVR